MYTSNDPNIQVLNYFVPKNMIDNVLNEIAKISVRSTQIGDVVLSKVCGLNVDVVVTGEAY